MDPPTSRWRRRALWRSWRWWNISRPNQGNASPRTGPRSPTRRAGEGFVSCAGCACPTLVPAAAGARRPGDAAALGREPHRPRELPPPFPRRAALTRHPVLKPRRGAPRCRPTAEQAARRRRLRPRPLHEPARPDDHQRRPAGDGAAVRASATAIPVATSYLLSVAVRIPLSGWLRRPIGTADLPLRPGGLHPRSLLCGLAGSPAADRPPRCRGRRRLMTPVGAAMVFRLPPPSVPASPPSRSS
jgi:hypothetical protein